MNSKDVVQVWTYLRYIGTEPHRYVNTYQDICAGILSTTVLSDMWKEGLSSVVSGEGLSEWGAKWDCPYSVLDGKDGWLWAIRWMSNKPLAEYIAEYGEQNG